MWVWMSALIWSTPADAHQTDASPLPGPIVTCRQFESKYAPCLSDHRTAGLPLHLVSSQQQQQQQQQQLPYLQCAYGPR